MQKYVLKRIYAFPEFYNLEIMLLIIWCILGVPHTMGFPGGAVVKNLSAMQETQETRVQFLRWEDTLGKEMATHFSILAWRILWTEEPGGLQSMRSQRIRHD